MASGYVVCLHTEFARVSTRHEWKAISTYHPRNRTLVWAGSEGRSERKARLEGKGPLSITTRDETSVVDGKFDFKKTEESPINRHPRDTSSAVDKSIVMTNTSLSLPSYHHLFYMLSVFRLFYSRIKEGKYQSSSFSPIVLLFFCFCASGAPSLVGYCLFIRHAITAVLHPSRLRLARHTYIDSLLSAPKIYGQRKGYRQEGFGKENCPQSKRGALRGKAKKRRNRRLLSGREVEINKEYIKRRMWSWFGGASAAQKRKDAPKNAILQLREQLDMLQKREKHLENQMAEQDAVARKNVSSNKNGMLGEMNGPFIRNQC